MMKEFEQRELEETATKNGSGNSSVEGSLRKGVFHGFRAVWFDRLAKVVALTGLYVAVSLLAFAAAYGIRFDGQVPAEYLDQFAWNVGWVMALQVGCLLLAGQAHVLPTFFGMRDLRSVMTANAVSGVLMVSVAALLPKRIPAGVIILDWVLLSGGVTVGRILVRRWGDLRRRAIDSLSARSGPALATAIVGAGSAGSELARELLKSPGLRLRPVVFFDDNRSKWNRTLHGIPIAGGPELLRQDRWRKLVRKVIVAMPNATAARVGEVARIAAEIGVPSDIIPALDQLVSGRVRVTQLRPIQIEDLLRRDTIGVDRSGIDEIVGGQVIAVTGAGGSIGSELCRQILADGPRQLLLIDRSEVQLFPIEQELLAIGAGTVVVPLVADITDPDRIREILRQYRPSVIFHAAAHKHVPMMENQPGEAVRNNSLGTANLARLAHEAGVGRFVLISTDKAINPTNVMGASKRLAEIFLQAFQQANPTPTCFMAVRFGNVLGSSGSVVPTFQKQIAAGGPITVTDPEVRRYFMTIPEAVGLVLHAGALGKGGEIFVLDMGKPVKIVDLARQMIELSGLKPDLDIAIRFTGLRPGEKLFEELSHQRELLTETVHPKIWRFICSSQPLSTVEEFLGRLAAGIYSTPPGEMKQALVEMVPEYIPYREGGEGRGGEGRNYEG